MFSAYRKQHSLVCILLLVLSFFFWMVLIFVGEREKREKETTWNKTNENKRVILLQSKGKLVTLLQWEKVYTCSPNSCFCLRAAPTKVYNCLFVNKYCFLLWMSWSRLHMKTVEEIPKLWWQGNKFKVAGKKFCKLKSPWLVLATDILTQYSCSNHISCQKLKYLLELFYSPFSQYEDEQKNLFL